MITGEHLEYLIGFLNSSVFKYCFTDNFPELQGGTRELRKIFLEKIPVLKITDKVNLIFKSKINRIQELVLQNKDTTVEEMEIDEMIFQLYGLNEEEKKHIGFIKIY